MGLRFSSKTVIFAFTVILTFVFVTALFLPTICVADKGKGKKKALGLKKEEVCHITGTYDFDNGIYDPSYGGVPIGQEILVTEGAHKIHLNHGDPETYKVVTLVDGSEVCRPLAVGEAQFENGIALFGHDVETGTHFTHHLSPKIGGRLAKMAYDDHHLESMTPIWHDGNQYVMHHTSHDSGDDQYKWFIQYIFPSGDFGPITDSGHFSHHYKTLITLTRPSGRVYIFGQRDYDDNASFTREVLPGGKLADHNADHTNRAHYYNAVTPLPNQYHVSFFAMDSDDGNHWIIDCIDSDGKFWSNLHGHNHDAGQGTDGYQVALSYRESGYSHLFLHRHHYTGGPWKFHDITYGSYLGGTTDSGTWDPNKHYNTMTTFYHPGAKKQYVLGHNTDKNWFIQHVSHYGNMDSRLESGGPWDHYYEHLFPINYDRFYLHPHKWMGSLVDEIDGFGDRTLSEIVLPGSHDAGMNIDDIDNCGFSSCAYNTITQNGNISYQLEEGARYFDIRPALKGGTNITDWHTGHTVKLLLTTAGCTGEGYESIIQGLKDFFANEQNNKELVILKISHCGSRPWSPFSKCSEKTFNELAANFSQKLRAAGVPVVTHDDTVPDKYLLNWTLNEILAIGNVLLVFNNENGFTRIPDQGLFHWGKDHDFWVYDSYSDMNKFDEMSDDQLAKFLINGEEPFLLSWTLTLTESEAILACSGDPWVSSIRERAAAAEPRIYEYMYNWRQPEAETITKSRLPNILYVDIFNRTATNAAIYLNMEYESLDP